MLGKYIQKTKECEDKIIKRPLVLYDYQIKAKDDVIESYNNGDDIVVLSMCPGSGKTEVSIEIIINFLNANPNSRVLVLAHSTNVLKENFLNRLKGIDLPYTFSEDVEDNSNIHISIPQNNKIKGSYGLLIIDEAHQNYLNDRSDRKECEYKVEKIIKKISTNTPLKQLLLTATPSKFVKIGTYKIIFLAMNEIHKEYFAKLNVELITINSKWKDNYKSLELRQNYEFIQNEVDKSVDNILEELIFRLSSKWPAEEFNKPNFISTIKTKLFTYKEIGKTLFVCAKVDQANYTYRALKKIGIDCKVSHHENDIKSIYVQEFLENKFPVLIVVNRARLGYSDIDLFNTVDMTGTLNPDTIYQMMCRTIRGNQNMTKFYLKLTTNEYEMMHITHGSVCASLMLSHRDFISKYKGSSPKNIIVPVFKKSIITRGKYNSRSIRNSEEESIFPPLGEDVFDTFIDILNNINNPVSIFKTTTLSESMKKIENHFTKKEIIDLIESD